MSKLDDIARKFATGSGAKLKPPGAKLKPPGAKAARRKARRAGDYLLLDYSDYAHIIRAGSESDAIRKARQILVSRFNTWGPPSDYEGRQGVVGWNETAGRGTRVAALYFPR